MNQRADSWKENFQLIVANPLICLWGWLLSHTMRRSRTQNRILGRLRGEFALNSGKMPGQA
jgi:hypothetical protein